MKHMERMDAIGKCLQSDLSETENITFTKGTNTFRSDRR